MFLYGGEELLEVVVGEGVVCGEVVGDCFLVCCGVEGWLLLLCSGGCCGLWGGVLLGGCACGEGECGGE